MANAAVLNTAVERHEGSSPSAPISTTIPWQLDRTPSPNGEAAGFDPAITGSTPVGVASSCHRGQTARHLICNQAIGGSNPLGGSICGWLAQWWGNCLENSRAERSWGFKSLAIRHNAPVTGDSIGGDCKSLGVATAGASPARRTKAPVVQLAEHPAHNRIVAGAGPAGGTILLLLAALLFSIPAGAKDKTYGSAIATVSSVHDGDTITVNVEDWPTVIGEKVGVRVYGIDTREMKDGGNVAKQFVKSLIPDGSEVLLSDIQRDKYFRILARIGYNCKGIKTKQPICQDLSTTLLEQKYAVPYFGATKSKFSKEIK